MGERKCGRECVLERVREREWWERESGRKCRRAWERVYGERVCGGECERERCVWESVCVDESLRERECVWERV